MNQYSKNQALIVLGMHRSGTSALTGVLSWLGCDLGHQLLPQHATNERGFWENFQVVEGNENVLKTLNTTWFNPAPFPKQWWLSENLIPLRDYLAKVLRQNFAGCPLWGLKDPRLCRLLPLWGPLLEQTGSALGFVIMVRNPHEVAASLARRDGLSPNTAVHLWLENVLAAEQDTRAFRRVFVTYDELLENGEALVDKIARDLNVNWPISFEWVADQIDRFLSSDLKHHHNVATLQLDRKLAAWSETVFRALRGAAEGNDDSLNVLETVRAALIKYKSSKTLEPIFPQPVYDRYEQWIEKQKLIRFSWLVRGFHEKRLAETVRFHFLIHLRRDQEALLKMTLEVLLALDYADWFLSIIADFSTIDPAVWGVKNLRWVMIDSEPVAAINREINVIGADWVALIDAGDRFEPDSLSICCRAIKTHSDWQLIYVDEDRINAEGVRFDPKFKPDFNLDGLRAMPYLGRFCLVRREAVEAVGGYASYWAMAYYDSNMVRGRWGIWLNCFFIVSM